MRRLIRYPLRSLRILVAFALCTLSSCSPNRVNEPCSKVLRIAMSHDPLSLDPRCVYLSRDVAICQFTYEGLMRASTDQLEPALATDIIISPCKTRYLFRLKHSTWSNGEPLTAYDFEQSIKDIFDYDVVSHTISLLAPIKNALNVLNKKAPVESLGLKALDAYTLEIVLEHPCEYFLDLLASPIYFPVHSSLRGEQAKRHTYSHVSNGAVTIQKFLPQNQIVLQKNPYYHDEQFVMPFDRMVFQVVPDHHTSVQLFRNNQIDWIGAPWSSTLSQEERRSIPPDQIHSYPLMATAALVCNVLHGPLQNKYLRKAIHLALDREKILPFIYPGQAAHHFTHPALSLLKDDPSKLSIEQRRQTAKEYLLLAKQTLSDKDLASITMIYPLDSSNLKDVVQEVQKQLKEVLNLDIHIQGLEYQCFLSKRRNFDFSLATGKWIAEYHHPLSFLSIFSSSSAFLHPILTQWENQEFNGLISDLSQIQYEGAKQEKAEQLLDEHLPVIPLYHFNYLYALNPKIQYQRSGFLRHTHLQQIQLSS